MTGQGAEFGADLRPERDRFDAPLGQLQSAQLSAFGIDDRFVVGREGEMRGDVAPVRGLQLIGVELDQIAYKARQEN